MFAVIHSCKAEKDIRVFTNIPDYHGGNLIVQLENTCRHCEAYNVSVSLEMLVQEKGVQVGKTVTVNIIESIHAGQKLAFTYHADSILIGLIGDKTAEFINCI